MKLNFYTAGRIFTALLICIATAASAQVVQIRSFQINDQAIIRSATDAHNYLLLHFTSLNDEACTIKLVTTRSSPYAVYYTFKQFYDEIEILSTQIKLCVDHSGNIKSIAGQIYDTEMWPLFSPVPEEFTIPQLLRSQFQLTTQSATPVLVVNENNIAELYYRIDENFENDRSRVTLLISAEGELIHADDHRSYFTTDTVVYGYVFKPDPLTSASVNYGGEYDDNNDADNTALHTELMEVEIRATFEDGYFYLRTDSLKLKDLGAPGDAVVIRMDDQFYFGRDDNNFEDVNTIFHIQHFTDYLAEIGYEQLGNFYIEIDPHGAGGADQSYFVGGEVPSIQFGEGGVDDAEDADVLIHEFTHGLSYNVAPNTNDGTERRAADEGYGDYFAVSYSRMYSDFNWEKVFSWDGHNEFWSGRNANTNKHYPEDLDADLYESSEIWSGALMDIYDAIGKENCDQLVCEALYASFEDMSLHDAALIVLTAEDLIFGGTYYETVYEMLDARGLLNPMSIEEPVSDTEIKFINTAGFCLGNESLLIELPEVEEFELKIYCVDGKLIYRTTGNHNIITIDPSLIHINCMIVTVSTPTESAAIQLIKIR